MAESAIVLPQGKSLHQGQQLERAKARPVFQGSSAFPMAGRRWRWRWGYGTTEPGTRQSWWVQNRASCHLPATSPAQRKPPGRQWPALSFCFLFPTQQGGREARSLYALGSSGLLASCPCAQQVHGSPAHYHSSF